jgi:hypothetical protein
LTRSYQSYEKWSRVSKFCGLSRELILGQLIDLRRHGQYVLDLVQLARNPALKTFRSANGRAQAATDILRKQDQGKMSDVENAVRVDTAKTNVARFCEKNWKTTFYNNFDFDGATGPAIVSPSVAAASRTKWSEFDDKARRELDAATLAVYEALNHYQHPHSGMFGTQLRRGGVKLDNSTTGQGGGCCLAVFSTPLDTARYWTLVLGPLDANRWATRPVMLKQDKKDFNGVRVPVAGVLS